MLVCLAIFCPINGKAQVGSQGFIISERQVNVQAIRGHKSIKSLNVGKDRIVSLTHCDTLPIFHENFVLSVGNNIYPKLKKSFRSCFFLNSEQEQFSRMAYVPGVTITDFTYDKYKDVIYFCGIINKTDMNIIGSFPISSVFYSGMPNSITYFPISLPDDAKLKKIDFYQTYATGQNKLSLIANSDNTIAIYEMNTPLYFSSSYFLTFDLANLSYKVKEISNVRLTEVSHTDTKVVVSGLRDFSHWVLFSHNQENLDNYDGRVYTTYTLYDHFREVQYNVRPMEKDKIVVGSSLIGENKYGYLEFAMFDLNSQDYLPYKVQAIDPNAPELECRSRISDMQYDEQKGILHVLFCNGAPKFGIRDMTIQINPFDDSEYYGAYVSVPFNTLEGFNILKSLVLYNFSNKYTYYQIFGSTAEEVSPNSWQFTGRPYFFDRIAYNYLYEHLDCERSYKFAVFNINSKYIPHIVQYSDSYDLTAVKYSDNHIWSDAGNQINCFTKMEE